MNPSPWMTEYLVKQGIFAQEPLSIVDVGASGGISSYWSVFEPYLHAVAFEPLIQECERLNRDPKKSSHTTYFPYFVISDDPSVATESGPHFASNYFERSSSVKATTLQKVDYIQEHFNAGKEVVYTDKKISLDRFFRDRPNDNVDFIKIDTDGYDYEVLDGARETILEREVVGITIEAQFHGKTTLHANTFRNIDRVMNEIGFTLFDLQPYRYTKKDLPGQFLYSIPAQTTTGQVLWGEAVYFRDYAKRLESKPINPIKLLKLACLFELLELPDCSAEVFNFYQRDLSQIIDVSKCLDLLVKNLGRKESYKDYLYRFESQIQDFYPKYGCANSERNFFKRVREKIKQGRRAIVKNFG